MSEGVAIGAEAGRSWTPPRVSGPLISSRGRSLPASEVESEAQAAFAAAYQRGYSEGMAAAAVEVNARLAQLDERIAAFQQIASRMARPLERLDEVAATELARLALTVGAQLARRRLEQEPGLVIDIIRDCLAALPVSTREVRVHLHPLDGREIRERLDPLRNESSWVLIDDHTVGRGGARVMVDSSAIDARLESRVVAAMSAVLADAREAVGRDVTAEIEAEGGL